jgi:predicted DCC family thiol-disulfide oxidoreductase YuxK
MEEGKKMGSWHLIDDQGRVHSAGKGLSELFRLLPGGRPLAEVFGRFPGASERFYYAIANNRDKIGPKLPRSWVESATRRVDRRRARQS